MKTRGTNSLRMALALIGGCAFMLLSAASVAANFGVIDDTHVERQVIVINGRPYQVDPNTELRMADDSDARDATAIMRAGMRERFTGMRVRFTARQRGDGELPLLLRLTVLPRDE